LRKLLHLQLAGTSSGDACSNEAGRYGEIDKASDACHAFDSSLSGLEGFATVAVLRMSRAALDRLGAAGAVKPAYGHPKSAGILAAT
jgi:hypothetical protein